MNKYYDIILPLIQDKKVLDLGSISHDFDKRYAAKEWNFDIFLKHAKYLKGIDILSTDVEKAQANGYDIEQGNAEQYISSEEKFDIVFAGDIIEHLANPGLFLKCSHENLVEDGLLIVVTPNTFSLSNIFKSITKLTNEPPVNPEHTCYFTPKTVQELASRERFLIKNLYYINTNYSKQKLKKMWKEQPFTRLQIQINYTLTKFLPHLSQALIVIFKKT
jgi:2-polyprenyl-3-methyl-5-hydroxy-6-metoxy-1,4-benzoquinol methylase